MAFSEAGKPAEKKDGKGIPKRWEMLIDDQCPMCTDDLELFEHLELWKCGCGFKISCYKKQNIEGDIEGDNSGFSLGNWHDEQPF